MVVFSWKTFINLLKNIFGVLQIFFPVTEIYSKILILNIWNRTRCTLLPSSLTQVDTSSCYCALHILHQALLCLSSNANLKYNAFSIVSIFPGGIKHGIEYFKFLNELS